MTTVLLCLIGFASGVVIAGGLFAFLILIGILPRFLQKTKTAAYIFFYESVITAGGVGGSLLLLCEKTLTLSPWWTLGIGLPYGIFVGCLAMALAEILDMLPILSRRLRLRRALPWAILMLAIGKMMGTWVHFFIPGMLR